ncbi:DUF2946 family protein [Zoogloea sp.]|uniref:DUF2946 family protein n=1 Tax=Zoogloea sp. TaxID=49181 RepID=UPI0025EE5C09|nr:DUF2946 family protein [Zoogloea sp.]MCK6395863.1 DUF2946 family protein [Zoogloea sp.]
MDEAVRLALAKWPNVPSCTGWLRLSRRGEWRVPEGPIRHAGLNAFIGRNYLATADGRWFFQNGPQQVFVSLDYTPVILRLANDTQLETHTGLPADTVSEAWLDEDGSLLLGSEHGIALLDDRDLAAFCTRLEGDLETPDAPVSLNWAGCRIPVGRIARADVASRFGFIPEPSL